MVYSEPNGIGKIFAYLFASRSTSYDRIRYIIRGRVYVFKLADTKSRVYSSRTKSTIKETHTRVYLRKNRKKGKFIRHIIRTPVASSARVSFFFLLNVLRKSNVCR